MKSAFIHKDALLDARRDWKRARRAYVDALLDARRDWKRARRAYVDLIFALQRRIRELESVLATVQKLANALADEKGGRK